MQFTHLNERGDARMVDVTAKQPTVRSATAEAMVACSPDVVRALRDGTVPKGDPSRRFNAFSNALRLSSTFIYQLFILFNLHP